ncbi:hypothetical protein ACWIEX_05985 [Bosea sp. NPDC055353]
MIDIDPIDPSDRIPLPSNNVTVDDVLVDFFHMELSDAEGRSLDLGMVPYPAGMSRLQATIWVGEVYFPQVIEPRCRHINNVLGDAPPDAEAIAWAKTLLQPWGPR